jgi:peptide/nickel transport system substrate-binding protein
VRLAAALGPGGSAHAAGLVIGRASEQLSLDPLFAQTGSNGDTATNMFDRLIREDPNNQPLPGLALSWKAVDPTTWRIALRPGVTFQDGGAFTADDVIFSLERARSVPNSPAPFSGAVRGVAALEAIDPLTLQVKTATPMPQLMEQIGGVYIMSRHAASGLQTSDFNAGRGMVGTGPYRFVSALPAQRVELAANPAYWDGAPAWDKVTLRFMPQDGGRVAALLAGDVDMIDQVPPSDVKQLQAGGKAAVFSIASTRLVYLGLDSARAQSPFVTDADGKPLDRNPLQDARVRQAISKMIDRNAIASRLLDGSAEPAGQMVPQGLGGFDPTLPPPALDLAGAKALLAAAGWPNGFGLTVHSSSDRLPKDSEVAQAIGQMLRRGGLRVNGVVPLPYNVYASAASHQSYSVFLFSFGTGTSNAADGLAHVVATYDAATSMGAFNRARYSNPAFDAVLAQAMATFDDAQRNVLLQQASHLAFTDAGIVPLYWQVLHWAARKGITYAPHRDETTAAIFAKPVE